MANLKLRHYRMVNALFLILFAAFTCLMATYAYLMIVSGEFAVREVVYSRKWTPIMYWLLLLTWVLLMAWGLVMVAVMIAGIAGAFG
jgi:hypothetical protein